MGLFSFKKKRELSLSIDGEYAFISYSTRNQQVADSVRALFAEHGIATWMAPYNIPSGSKYAAVINDALMHCSCLVLLLSDASQSSEYVDREVERAISYKKPILPLQLEKMELNSSFQFYIGSCQIIPVMNLKSDSVEVQRVLAGVKQFVKSSETFSEIMQVPSCESFVVKTEEKDIAPVYNDLDLESMTSEQIYVLAEKYYYGKDVEKNLERSFDLYLSAAEHGYEKAYYDVGYAYRYGKGVEKDDERAFVWLLRSAECGESKAQYRVGYMYGNAIGTEQNYEKSYYWHIKAAQNGNKDSKCSLGYMYEKGRFVEKDLEKAFKWYQEAANAGDDCAQSNLGNFYEHGYGVEQNEEEAIKWYTKSARQGYAQAQYRLGKCYEYGIGVPIDEEMAIVWYKKAAAGGNTSAKKQLKQLKNAEE